MPGITARMRWAVITALPVATAGLRLPVGRSRWSPGDAIDGGRACYFDLKKSAECDG
jgi:hypothetical protein